MRSGIRLTQLAIGEPLLLTNWSYKNLTGVPAVEQRLWDLFGYAKHSGFNNIIDTIKPEYKNREIILEDTGLGGDIWGFSRRMELYESCSKMHKLDVVLEIDFPYVITESNWQEFADFSLNLIKKYNWVKYWQIGKRPDEYDKIYSTKYRCNALLYYKIMNYIYPRVKSNSSNVFILGPGVCDSLIKYYNGDKNTWLGIAVGDNTEDPMYEEIGSKGILDYIDFFSIEGRQELEGLSYDKFSSVVDFIHSMFIMKMSPIKEIISIYQGRSSDDNDESSHREQVFFEVREFINCFRNGVIPFKNQLVDEVQAAVNHGYISNKDLGYGIYRYHLGTNGSKPIQHTYSFILNTLLNYNRVTRTSDVIVDNNQTELLTLKSSDDKYIATIIWGKHMNGVDVVLKPHFSRTYVTVETGRPQSVTRPITIKLSDYNQFVIVIEQLSSDKVDIEAIEEYIDKKLNYTEKSLANLINVLPGSYNKEVKDLNYYKLLRAFSLEIADAEIQVERVKDNLYIDTVRGDAIYNNFGVLVNLAKKNSWSEEQYKGLVKGVTQSLLRGPTPKSIIDAIKLFTNFEIDVNLYELYKNKRLIDDPMFDGINSKFAFVVEIEKPIDNTMDRNTLYNEVQYVINIVKPAHTLSIVLITLVGKENYKDYYRDKYKQEFSNSDEYVTGYDLNLNETPYGWKLGGNNLSFKTAGFNSRYPNSLTNSSAFLGPRYVLYDEELLHMTHSLSESDIVEIEEEIDVMLGMYNYETYDKLRAEILQEFEYGLEDKFVSSYYTKLNKELVYYNNLLDYNTKLKSLVMPYTNEAAYDEYSKNFESSIYKEVVTNMVDDALTFGPMLYNEKHDSADDNLGTINFSSMNIENYRTPSVMDETYHQHRRVTSIVSTKEEAKVFTVGGDLFTSSTKDKISPARVYLNGVLLPDWTYTEIKSANVPGKSEGIALEAGFAAPGDHLSLIYMKDQTAYEGVFPISEGIEIGPEVVENVGWIQHKKPVPKNKFKLNLSTLNNFILYGTAKQELYEMEMFRYDYNIKKTIKKRSFS